MKLRLVAALLLLLVAVGLPLAAVSSNGPPWGFRGHDAVVIGVAGTVEATAGDARRTRQHLLDDRLDVKPGLSLDAGDEIRVARLSEVVLRTANADVTIGDGARALVGPGSLRLVRGLVQVQLLPPGVEGGRRTFTVELDAGGTLVLAGTGARASILADGKGNAQAIVENGSLDARVKASAALLEPGQLLSVRGDVASVGAVPSGFEVSATCASGHLNVVAPALTQIFASGAMGYPDVAPEAATGSLILDVDAGTREAIVFARTLTGKLARVAAPCPAGK